MPRALDCFYYCSGLLNYRFESINFVYQIELNLSGCYSERNFHQV